MFIKAKFYLVIIALALGFQVNAASIQDCKWLDEKEKEMNIELDKRWNSLDFDDEDQKILDGCAKLAGLTAGLAGEKSSSGKSGHLSSCFLLGCGASEKTKNCWNKSLELKSIFQDYLKIKYLKSENDCP